MNIFIAKDECGCIVAGRLDRHDAVKDIQDQDQSLRDRAAYESEAVSNYNAILSRKVLLEAIVSDLRGLVVAAYREGYLDVGAPKPFIKKWDLSTSRRRLAAILKRLEAGR